MTQVILVPGSAVVQKRDRVDPDQRYKSRLLSALQLYLRNPSGSVIVVSGGVFNPTEAQVGKIYLQRKGVPEERIVSCDTARDTYENSMEFSQSTGQVEKPEYHLVTNGFHSLRAYIVCRLFGIRPKVHTTENLLKERYSGMKVDTEGVIRNASEIKPGENIPNLIGLVAAIGDYILSLGGRINFHPLNHTISRYLGYDRRELIKPPSFEEWNSRLYQ